MSDERVNRAIDEVARQMTEEAPTTNGADFRRRVLARIAASEAPRASWRPAFVLSPVALAAAIVIAVFIVRKPGPVGRGGAAGPEGPALQPVATAAAKVGAELAPLVTREPETTHRSTQAVRRPGPFGPGVTRVATAAASEVEALSPPALDAPALAITTLTTESIALDRLETPARIAIAPLATPEGERQ